MHLPPCLPQELPLSHSDIIQIAGLGAAYAAILMASVASRKYFLLRPIEYGCYFVVIVFMFSILLDILWLWKPTWAGGGLYEFANYGVYFGLILLILLCSFNLFLLILIDLIYAILKDERWKIVRRSLQP